MRRIIIVGAALGLMWGLPGLTVSAGDEAFDPMTLAAVGFVLLAAFAVGEFGSFLKLPKVTGYIVSGAILGPFVLNILSRRVAGEMKIFNTLALGLIALTAGLELDVKALAKVSRTLFSTIVFKIPLLLLLVGGAFFGIQTYYPVLTDLPAQAILPLALIFAVLAIGTSPAIAIAVVSESKAKGRLSDLVLAIAVAKDLVVVVSLALALAYCKALLSPSGAFDVHELMFLGKELGLSLLTGAVVGTVLILYSKFVRAEPLMALLIVVAIAAEASRLLHLELLLVLIAAGFTVRNFSKQEHHLLSPLGRISLPVFVVFFTTAGANVDLVATLKVLPLAFALVVARAGAYAIAARLGGAVGREADAVKRNAWLAYLPQAGVTLGLVLIAAQALPELAIPILQTGMASVALNLLFGPVLMSAALRRAGEVPGAEKTDASSETVDADSGSVSTQSTPRSNAAVDDTPAADGSEIITALDVEVVAKQTGSEEAAAQIVRLEEALFEAADTVLGETVGPKAVHGAQTVLQLLKGENRDAVLDNIALLLESAAPEMSDNWEVSVSSLLSKELNAVRSISTMVEAALPPSILRTLPQDTASLRWRKRGVRTARFFGMKMGRKREIPLQLVARIALEPRLAKAASAVSVSWYRTVAGAVAQVQGAVDDLQDVDSTRVSVENLFRWWHASVQTDLRWAIRSGVRVLCENAAVAGTPVLPRRQLRYSRVSQLMIDETDRITSKSAEWQAVVHAAFNTVRIAALNQIALRRIVELNKKRTLDALSEVETDLLPDVKAAATRVSVLREAARAETDWSASTLEDYLARAESVFTQEERKRIRRRSAAYRSVSRKSYFTADVASIIASYPTSTTLLPQGLRPSETADPSEVSLVEIDCGQRVSLVLGEQILKRLAQVPVQVGAQLVVMEPSLREVVHVITYGIETASRRSEEEEGIRSELILGALERAATRSRQLFDELSKSIVAAREESEAVLAQLAEQLPREIRRKRMTAQSIQSTVALRARKAARERLGRFKKWASEKWSPLARIVGVASKRSMEEWQIQSGALRLDAAGIANYCGKRMPDIRALHLPNVYKEALSIEPVGDRRMLAARKTLVEQISASMTAKDNHTNLLLIGARGSGKTTLTAEVNFRLSDKGVIRLDGSTMSRGESLIGALAYEMDCPNNAELVTARLISDGPIVIVDDLEKIFLPTQRGTEAVSAWLDLVVATSGKVKWLATVTRELYALLTALGLPFEKAFGQIVQLMPLDWRELKEVFSARQRLAGIPIRIERQTAFLDFVFRRWKGSRESQYYRALESTSGGNLRAAVLIHLRSLTMDGDTLVYKEPRRFSTPFMQWLPEDATALLAELVRLGPMTGEHILEIMALTENEQRALLLFLTQSGLVRQKTTGYEETYAIAAHLEDAIAGSLAGRNLFEENAS